MPGLIMDEIKEEAMMNEVNGTSSHTKENSVLNKSPSSTPSPRSPHSADHPIKGMVQVDTSIEQLYENVCDMQSSDQSPSRQSFGSYGEESRIDSELRHLIGGEMREVEIMQVEVDKPEDDSHSNSSSKKGSSSSGKKSGQLDKTKSASVKSISLGHVKIASQSQLDSEASKKPSLKGKSPPEKPPIDKRKNKTLKKSNTGVLSMKKGKGSKLRNGTEDASESGSGNPDLGPFLLKQARDMVSSGDNPQKALELALRAAKSYEICANGKPSLELVMCLHVTAAIYCSLSHYSEAIPLLEQSIEIPLIEEGQEHALAKFAGHMQLGDTYAMLGQLENSITCYSTGFEVQKQVLGETDPRVGETCRYLAEAHVQALQFDEAQRLCQMALDIHKENGSPASLEEAADRRLMGLICETKGDHEAALEHLVLASMAMVANGQEAEVASVDCSIGDTYLSLSRYDEAVFAYQKALTAFKTTKGDNHPAIGSVFVRLADLYNRTGKLKESKSYCENALRIYEKPMTGIPPEEIAGGLTDVSAIYESMDDLDQAIKLLQKALKIYNDAPGQQSTIAGIEAQMGVMYYMLGNYSESYNSLKSAISKLRGCGERKSAFFGIALNQMGLACVQSYAINEAVELFEEAKSILEQECGPYHPDTLGVYSNLAGTYDAIGRLDDAIEILEYVVQMREEKLGTANPEVYDEKKRLAELLKEAGRVRSRKARSLETLLDANPHNLKGEGIKV
ncbi:protein KINESIN LIGHT CHAIN-RELATED 3-like [Durio zibethinus]|uniref:Protein KINESIN LIGHT CHAIN-RELATED 3-like n=1 Tax=Durio zibethinus TaxID=66656 RepID=A0A6P6AR68_DURZI|nr:protein KINESIN LIGHT CHAIN-RELATED 3-like [Durio zibethinus]XP_022767278.1 protein KINESIN LIGHT CHAIN-RELATED 3-like [Durio zibethinus]XP_022767287.1 protein KINESIN LIGHT CHAIN-RELATED 3-like [Durio zibethinus]XP_022767296.1 protein KINESIN LIGHT CHAIN-RELATED 3-like [Durio zibethinus]